MPKLVDLREATMQGPSSHQWRRCPSLSTSKRRRCKGLAATEEARKLLLQDEGGADTSLDAPEGAPMPS